MNRLYNDQKTIIHYIKNQTSFILNAINANNEILNKSRDQIQRVNEQFNKIRDLSKTNELNIDIDKIMLDLEIALNELREKNTKNRGLNIRC